MDFVIVGVCRSLYSWGWFSVLLRVFFVGGWEVIFCFVWNGLLLEVVVGDVWYFGVLFR